MPVYILIVTHHFYIWALNLFCWLSFLLFISHYRHFNHFCCLLLFWLLPSLLLLRTSYACLVLYYVDNLVWTDFLDSLHWVKCSSSFFNTCIKLSRKELHFNAVFFQTIGLILVALTELLESVHLHTLILLLLFNFQKPWPYDVVHYPQPKYFRSWFTLFLAWLKDCVLILRHRVAN